MEYCKSLLGSGSRYTEIYNLNKDKIKNPNLIYPGQVLRIPGVMSMGKIKFLVFKDGATYDMERAGWQGDMGWAGKVPPPVMSPSPCSTTTAGNTPVLALT